MLSINLLNFVNLNQWVSIAEEHGEEPTNIMKNVDYLPYLRTQEKD